MIGNSRLQALRLYVTPLHDVTRHIIFQVILFSIHSESKKVHSRNPFLMIPNHIKPAF